MRSEQLTQYSAKDVLSSVEGILEENSGFGVARPELKCISKTCGATYPTEPEPVYNCKVEGEILDVVYDFPKDLDPEKLKSVWALRRTSQKPYDRSGVWRFRELLWVKDQEKITTLNEGNTPLLEAFESAKYVGLRRLRFKHQGWNPTGSFKDPGMSAAITQAKILGMKAVACSSTGNTSASEAAYAKRAGMLPIVLIPEGQISYGKLSQAIDYGAKVFQIGGDFDKAMEMVMNVAPGLGIYVVNSINPFRIEGQKTMVFELLEQLNWEVPNRIVVPGGNLGNASSVAKALRELQELGFIDKLPKLTIIQAKGADPLYETVTKHSKKLIIVRADTLATAIKIGNPVSWEKAKKGLEITDGWVSEVTEQEIADAKAIIGRDGIGCEPASAVTLAGLKKLVEEGTDNPFDKDEVVVAILTGNVLKDSEYTVKYHLGELKFHEQTIYPTYGNRPIQIEPDEKLLEEAILKEIN